MSEAIKKFWYNAEILAVKSWHDSSKGLEQIDRENNFPLGTLFKLVNSIQDYKRTRCNIGKWLRNELPLLKGTLPRQKKNVSKRKKEMQNKISLHNSVTDQNRIERQLMRA